MVQKTNRPFSAIPVDQAHEQNNASAIKGDGGAVGLTDNLDDGGWWQDQRLPGSSKEYQDATEPENRSQDTEHHD